MLFVFIPCCCGDGPQLAACQCGFEDIGRVACASRATCTDQCVGFINEQDNWGRRGLNFVNDGFQALLELSFHGRPRLHQADIQHIKGDILQLRWHVATHKTLRETFDNGCFADACLPRQDWVILTPAHQNINDLAYFRVTANHRVHFARACIRGHVCGVKFKG